MVLYRSNTHAGTPIHPMFKFFGFFFNESIFIIHNSPFFYMRVIYYAYMKYILCSIFLYRMVYTSVCYVLYMVAYIYCICYILAWYLTVCIIFCVCVYNIYSWCRYAIIHNKIYINVICMPDRKFSWYMNLSKYISLPFFVLPTIIVGRIKGVLRTRRYNWIR